MKPLVLTMKAFGSYGQQTVVDFTQLDSGLYLITGDTGAGKTTIFDAMVYALFGEASGSGRTGISLHSDYASKKEDTVVTLEFLHNQKFYKVERTIHFPQSRDGGFGDPKQSAVLRKEDGSVIEVSSKVNKKISEIIGLDANQFKQIIVLAQGEFQKFLNANSLERNNILGKLFDNSAYVRFQTRLKKAADEINDKVKKTKDNIDAKMMEFKYPQDQNQLLFVSSNPSYVDNIKALIVTECEQKTMLEQERTQIQESLNSIIIKKERALIQNKALDILQELRLKTKTLEESKTSYEVLESNIKLVDKANSNVTPLKNAYDLSLQQYQKNNDELLQAMSNLHHAKAQQEVAATQFMQVVQLNQQNTSLATSLDNLKKQLESFIPYKQKCAELDLAINNQNSLQDDCKKIIEQKDILESNKQAYSKRLAEIKPQVDNYQAIKLDYEKASDKFLELESSNGLLATLQKISNDERTLIEEKTKELKINDEFSNALAKYSLLNEQFLKSQATILAKELKIELENHNQATCPVCHTELTQENIVNLAIDESFSITKQQVDDAENDYKQKQALYIHINTNNQRLSERIDSTKNHVLELAIRLGCTIDSYEQLTAEYVQSFKQLLLDNKENAYKLYQKVDLLKKEYTTLEKTIMTTDASLKDIENKLNESSTLLNDQAIVVLKLETEKTALFKSLNGSSEEEIKSSIVNVTNLIEANSKMITSLTNNKNKADANFTAYSSKVELLTKSNSELQALVELKKDKYSTALSDNGFTDEQDYLSTLSVAGSNVNGWLDTSRTKVQQYRENYKSISDQLTIQEETCKAYIYTNIETIDQEKISQEMLQKENNAKLEALNKLIDNHESTLSFIETSNASIAKYLPASQRLSKLSELANATVNTEGGKITFDRYVMGNAFEEILTAANVHLTIMASGQFELIHQTKGEGASSHAGLGIDVLDVFTGEQRKPESLSGGEKFQVSMALALGLSDVVQNHAGGKKIDSMYIDEGFGSLDEEILDKAITILNTIAGTTRQIGIISHVERLEESISQKIVVSKSDNGSSLRIVK